MFPEVANIEPECRDNETTFNFEFTKAIIVQFSIDVVEIQFLGLYVGQVIETACPQM